MSSNPFLFSCGNCGGSGQTGWFFQEKKICNPCGGTGYGLPNRDYWFRFLHEKLEMEKKDTSASNLPHIESGITAIEKLITAAPANTNTHAWLLGELYQSKGFILGDIAETRHNQHVLFLESVEYLRKAEKLGIEGVDSSVKRILQRFQWICSPDEQKNIISLYKSKYPNKEIPR